MDLNWFESFLYGLFSGLTDILPVSAEAHRILMLKCFGIQSSTELMSCSRILACSARCISAAASRSSAFIGRAVWRGCPNAAAVGRWIPGA